MRARIVPDVEVVIAARTDLFEGRRIRYGANQPGAGILAAHDLAEIVDECLRVVDRREVQDSSIRMLVREGVVETAGSRGVPDAGDFLHLARVGKPGHVEDD